MTKHTRKNRVSRRNGQIQYYHWDNSMTSVNEEMSQRIVKMNTTIANELSTYSSLSKNSRHAFFLNSHGMFTTTGHILDYKTF
jgi:aspartate/tyrosine/aromatic aminotransferase